MGGDRVDFSFEVDKDATLLLNTPASTLVRKSRIRGRGARCATCGSRQWYSTVKKKSGYCIVSKNNISHLLLPPPSRPPQVYKAKRDQATSTLNVAATVADGGLLVLAPDPVVPFKDSRYSQHQTFEIEEGGT